MPPGLSRKGRRRFTTPAVFYAWQPTPSNDFPSNTCTSCPGLAKRRLPGPAHAAQLRQPRSPSPRRAARDVPDGSHRAGAARCRPGRAYLPAGRRADRRPAGAIGPPDGDRKTVGRKPRAAAAPGFFNATQLLYTAYNGKFPHPQAVEFKVKITAPTPEDLAVFDQEPAVPLLRLLMGGLTDRALLHRLFSEQLAGSEFAEAPNILWQLTSSEKIADSVVFDVVSSDYWLEDFKYADTYEAGLPAE
ncbi:MAG: hypothetical protein WKG07_38130 [Hymenobacter sp.]